MTKDNVAFNCFAAITVVLHLAVAASADLDAIASHVALM